METQSRSRFTISDFLIRFLVILLCFDAFAWIVGIPIALRGNADLRNLYAAGYMVRSGQRHLLYDYDTQKRVQDALVSPQDVPLRFIRPAYQALLFVPFSLLSYRAAYFSLLAINVVLLGLCVRMLRPWTANLAGVAKRLPEGLFLACFPVSIALMQGQDTTLLLFLLTAALVALFRGRETMAGALVGLGMFKFQIALPIGLFFLMWRRWRFSAGFAAAAATTAAVSVLVVGFGSTKAFARSLLSVGAGMLPADHPVLDLGVFLMANLRGLVAVIAGAFLSPTWVQALIAVLSAAVIIWIGIFVKPKPSGADALVLAITASAVVSYYLFIHDLSVTLVPIIVCLNRYMKAGNRGDRFGSAIVIAAVSLYVAPAFLFLSPSLVYLAAVPLIALLFLMTSSLKRVGSIGAT